MANAGKGFIELIADKLSPVRYRILLFFQRSRDDWYWKQFYANKKRSFLLRAQRIDYEDHIDQGPDLAAARFVIKSCRGRIRDERNIWITKTSDLPAAYNRSFKVTALEITHSNLMTEGTDNFADLERLQFLDLRSNKYLDDFACDQISRQFRKSKCLEIIDLSYNKRISVHGLNILFRIPSLKEIRAVETRATEYPGIDLFTLAAEEERGCRVSAKRADSMPAISANLVK